MPNLRKSAIASFLCLFAILTACEPDVTLSAPSSSIALPVTGLKAIRDGEKVTLSWDAHPAAKEYELARSHTKAPAALAAQNAALAGGRRLKPASGWANNTTVATNQFEEELGDYGVFTYKVRAVSADRRTSPWSEEVSIDMGSPRELHPMDIFFSQCDALPDPAIPEVGIWVTNEMAQAIIICEHSGKLRLAFSKDGSENLGMLEMFYQEGDLALGAGTLGITWTYAETERFEFENERSIVTVLETPGPETWSYRLDGEIMVVEGVEYLSMLGVAPEGPTGPTNIIYSAAPTTTPWNTAADAGLGTQLFGPNADEDFIEIELPFTVPFYGKPFSTLTVTVNGVVYFGTPGIEGFPMIWEIPNSWDPYMLALAWDDLVVAAGGRVAWAVSGDEPERTAVITFTKLHPYVMPGKLLTFQAEFSEASGAFTVRYQAFASGTDVIAGTNYGDGLSGTSWAITSNTALLVTPEE